ncbi:envelope stress response membrane protein PspB [Hyphomonas oceanitis]|uniref:Phage shock protein B n=1 Tax=Hyphomonas oceanitis SCH89 TaxID=1280953 RepID=A0A059G753_9PROT|nr:envelope stress response membrane protein PspB [Hyphomonas oceanitis]KDA02375.1 phage shock protein B [Hyphomonas oceanitis SCH89]|tara:strand:+ start:643 stop:906 length:264 start_codon:yes stop_codon:yes gene_type:complete
MDEGLIALVAILSIFVFLPGMVLHYVSQWRRQKTLQPDDERMLEDLWRSAKAMERRLETLEALLAHDDDDTRERGRPVRRPRSTLDD